MDPNVVRFFEFMMTLGVSVAVGAGLFVLFTSFAKRLRGPSRGASAEEIEDLRARLQVLEQGTSQYEELDERLEFLERVVLALREGRSAAQVLPPRKGKTPI